MLATSRLKLNDLAAPEAWSRLEQYLGVSLRRHLQGVIDRLREGADVLTSMSRAAHSPTALVAVRQRLLAFRRQISSAPRRRSTISPTRSGRARTCARPRCCAPATRWRIAAWRRFWTRLARRRPSC